MVSPPSAFEKTDGWGGKSNQSLLLSLPPTHYPNSSQSQKNLLVLDVLGLLHQEALALKKRHRDPRSRATQQACCREREEVKKRGILEAWRERGGENLVSSRPPEAKILSGERPPSRKYGVTPKKSVRENLFCTALGVVSCPARHQPTGVGFPLTLVST